MDAATIRRLVVLKVWFDVIDDGLGTKPFDPNDVLRGRRPTHFDEEAIGYLTTPVDLPGWIATVESRFAFLADLESEDERVAHCNPGDRWHVQQLVAAISAPDAR